MQLIILGIIAYFVGLIVTAFIHGRALGQRWTKEEWRGHQNTVDLNAQATRCAIFWPIYGLAFTLHFHARTQYWERERLRAESIEAENRVDAYLAKELAS